VLKKIVGLALASVLLLTLLVGGTAAYFSDTGKASQNAIAAGQLYLLTSNDDGVSYSSGVVQTLTSLKLKPTQSKSATIKLKNDSNNLDASYLDIAYSYTKVDGNQNGTSTMSADATAAIIKITLLQRDRAPHLVNLLPYVTDWNGNTWVDLQDLAYWTSGVDSSHMVLSNLTGLSHNGTTTITIGIQMASYTEVGVKSTLDAFQGDGVNITMKYSLRQ
jgi:predicted ribosomally synthesized peptide with SipW-like signal peptide